jgi:2-haloacid dehalogenase
VTAPRWVVFDLNGTLVDPGPLAAAWGDPVQHRSVAIAALRDAVLQAMADTHAGVFRPFPELLEAGLARQAALAGLDAALAPQAAQRAAEMPAYPDAAEALATLRGAGLRVAVLTNSATDAAEGVLRSAGLRDLVHEVVGVDQVGRYKPHPDVYAHGLRVLRAAAGDAWFVAGHGWDVGAAKRAGMRTAWVAREEIVLLRAVPAPDIESPDLLGAAEQIVRQPR